MGTNSSVTQWRQAGGVAYRLTRKKVKNLNLRVGPDGQAAVSAPPRVPVEQVDAFVAAQAAWVERAKARMAQQASRLAAEQVYTPAQCQAAFAALVGQLQPLVQQYLPTVPAVEARPMKSRWGVCYPSRGKVVFNTRLMAQPLPLQEYVVLHELVHFGYPNHGKGFHDEMARLMPDYRQRRRALG